jgi:iron complex outermembrane receptor protein
MASTLIGGLSVAAPAMAQDEANDDTIVVTGSRIARQDFVANSPVATVDAAQFEMTGTVNTESLLNTLPQTVPGLDRTSNNPGNGTATVNLRGLGSGRTLVLVDGTRAMPGGTGGTVDINTIPASLIERVEVVTGGASAVYGSDAVAGVVNFILKDDFEGMEFNVGYEQTQRGDGRFQTGDITLGGNFDNGRGNVVLNMGYVNREEVFQGDRSFSREAFGGDQNNLVPLGSSGVPAGHLFSFAGAMDWTAAGLYFPGACPEGLTDTGAACMGDVIFDTNGNPQPWVNSGPNNTRYNYAPVNYLQLPQERYSATMLGNYDVTDTMNAYTRVMFSQNQVDQQLAPTPAFTFLDVNLNNPFLGADTVALLTPNDTDLDGIVNVFLGRRMVEVGFRRSNDTRSVFQFQAGLRGELGTNWEWDVYFQTGRSFASSSIEGDVSQPRLAQAVLTDDGVTCRDTSNGCVPINVFGAGNISDAAAQFVSTRLNSENERNQKVFSATIFGDTGGWVELPGGPIGLAAGFEYRDEDADFRPSQDLAAGTLLGFNAAPPVGGHYDVYDFYGEALLPILSGVEFAEVLEIELAARYSDYSTAGGTDAYKVAGRWAPISEVTFRGSYNTATRAPNVGELFSPASNGFPGASDPCAAPTLGAYVAGDARLDALCIATGVAVPGADFQPNGQIEAIVGGNPGLGAEEAETITFGVILEPSVVDGLTLSIDYFDIEMTDIIAAPSAQFILDSCYSVGTQAGGGNTDPNSEFCSRISRFPGGSAIDTISASLGNVALARTTGIDLMVDWDLGDYVPEFLAGDWSVGFLGTYWEENSSQQNVTTASVDCIGIFSGSCGEPNPEWTHRATVDWMNGPVTAQMVWRHLGESVSEDGIDTIDAENYFDFSGSYEINEHYSLTGGVDNVFDTTPPILGDNQEQANTWPASYDVFGRTFWVSVRGRF